jgi:hypothetical protein
MKEMENQKREKKRTKKYERRLQGSYSAQPPNRPMAHPR